MNNRIKELAVEAKLIVTECNGFDSNKLSADLQRFAELILKECIGLMDRQNRYYADTGTYESREYYELCQAKEEAFEEASDSIKYHFGVQK